MQVHPFAAVQPIASPGQDVTFDTGASFSEVFVSAPIAQSGLAPLRDAPWFARAASPEVELTLLHETPERKADGSCDITQEHDLSLFSGFESKDSRPVLIAAPQSARVLKAAGPRDAAPLYIPEVPFADSSRMSAEPPLASSIVHGPQDKETVIDASSRSARPESGVGASSGNPAMAYFPVAQIDAAQGWAHVEIEQAKHLPQDQSAQPPPHETRSAQTPPTSWVHTTVARAQSGAKTPALPTEAKVAPPIQTQQIAAVSMAGLSETGGVPPTPPAPVQVVEASPFATEFVDRPLEGHGSQDGGIAQGPWDSALPLPSKPKDDIVLRTKVELPKVVSKGQLPEGVEPIDIPPRPQKQGTIEADPIAGPASLTSAIQMLTRDDSLNSSSLLRFPVVTLPSTNDISSTNLHLMDALLIEPGTVPREPDTAPATKPVLPAASLLRVASVATQPVPIGVIDTGAEGVPAPMTQTSRQTESSLPATSPPKPAPDLLLRNTALPTVEIAVAEPMSASPRDAVHSVSWMQSAPTALPAAGSTPLVPPQQVGQILAQIVRQGTDGPVELTLRPEELGRIKFELMTTGDKLQITLFVERPEAFELMRRHSDQFLNDLRQSGFTQTTLNFGEWSQRRSQSDPSIAANAPMPDCDTAIDGAPMTRPQIGAVALGRLHLRL